MSGRGGPNNNNKNSGRGGRGGRGNNNNKPTQNASSSTKELGGGVGRGAPIPAKGIGRGSAPPVNMFKLPQSVKKELEDIRKENESFSQRQNEIRFKLEETTKRLEDCKGSQILVLKEIKTIEHRKTKVSDPKLDANLQKYRDEHTKLQKEQSQIQKEIQDQEKELSNLNERTEANHKKIEKKKEKN